MVRLALVLFVGLSVAFNITEDKIGTLFPTVKQNTSVKFQLLYESFAYILQQTVFPWLTVTFLETVMFCGLDENVPLETLIISPPVKFSANTQVLNPMLSDQLT